MTSRVLATAAEWDLAARLKRDRDLAELVDGPSSRREVEDAAGGAAHEDEGEIERGLARLREEARGGELRAWFRRHEMLGFAALRETPARHRAGARVLVVRQLYIFRADAARAIARDLAAIADARGIEEADLTLPADHLAAFETAGFAPTLVLARRRVRD